MSVQDSNPERPVRVLFVCLGNICRSPMAEGLFRHQVRQAGLAARIKTDSAGTADYHVGRAPDVRAQRACAARGMDITDLSARQVAYEDFYTFEYILAMDADNLDYLRAIRPAGAQAKLALFMDYADGPYHGRSVPDPYYGDIEDFHRTLAMIESGAQGLLREIQRERLKSG